MSLSKSKSVAEHVIQMDIAAEPTPPSSVRDSLDDPYRRELLWRQSIDDIVTKTREEADIASKAHSVAAKKARNLYNLFGLPTVLIPVLGSLVSTYDDVPQLVITTLLLLTGLLSAGQNFMNFGRKSQTHYEYAARWMDISSNIQYEMAKPKQDRTAADVFIERLRNRTAALRAGEPPR